MYGWGHNEELISPVLKESRNKVFICTKFGFSRGPNGEVRIIQACWLGCLTDTYRCLAFEAILNMFERLARSL